MNGSAVISPDGLYRYRLARWWADGPRVLWAMLNPSTADVTADDPTIRKCIGFAKKWGFAGIEVVNLFALRSSNPTDLRDSAEAGIDPVGPFNNNAIYRAAGEVFIGGGSAIAAWGAWQDELAEARVAAVRPLLPAVRALRITASGSPGHPLYVPYSACPMPWPASAAPVAATAETP